MALRMVLVLFSELLFALDLKICATPSPRTPGAVFTPVRGGRTGMSTSGASFLGSV